MNQQDFLQLRQEIIQRARAIPRPTSYQVEIEKLQARKLAQFLLTRLDQLEWTAHSLARSLDIELEFVQSLLNATFPVSQLSSDMLNEMAEVLRCDVGDVRAAMQVDQD